MALSRVFLSIIAAVFAGIGVWRAFRLQKALQASGATPARRAAAAGVAAPVLVSVALTSIGLALPHIAGLLTE